MSLPRVRRRFCRITALGLALGLGGCAHDRPFPLARGPDLASGLARLDVAIPGAANGHAPQRIDIGRPLGIDQIGLLAILNDPELRTERGEIGTARARALQATLLPNPSIGLGFAALLGGPGTTGSYMASLSQDVASLVTYHARTSAAKANVSAVNADLLWREWQVAQKARLLAFDIDADDRSIRVSARELDLLTRELAAVKAATAAGNLDLSALAPLSAAKAAAEQAFASFRLGRLKNWQALDALLGLEPDVRFAIAAPRLAPLPADLDPLIANLPQRRPDLVALQLGYRAAETDVRAAILGQFPAFVVGGSWSSDTSGVRSAGPSFTFDLPIFNRNQGRIADARATRQRLHANYQARLDSAVGDIRGLLAQTRRLSADLVAARAAAATARSLADTARRAYAQGNLDQRAVTDYETTALERTLAVIGDERSLGEARIMLVVELGLGLPKARIVPS